MKKLQLLIVLVFIIISGYAQNSKTDDFIPEQNFKPTFISGWVSFNNILEYQMSFFHPGNQSLNNYLKINYNHSIPDYFPMFGIAFQGVLQVGAFATYDSHFALQMMIPSPITISDSLSFKTSGFRFGFDSGKDLFSKNKAFDLFIGLGLDFGRYSFMKKDLLIGNDFLSYRNPYLAPKFVAGPRMNLKRFSVSARGEYQFDISNSDWKFKDYRLAKIASSKMTGLNLILSLGILLNN